MRCLLVFLLSFAMQQAVFSSLLFDRESAVLSDQEMEMIVSFPETSYIYVPLESRQEMKRIQALFQEEDFDESSQVLKEYIDRGFQIVPHPILQQALVRAGLFLEKHFSKSEVGAWKERMITANPSCQEQLRSEKHTLSSKDPSSSIYQDHTREVTDAIPCSWFRGPRGKKGHQGSQGPMGSSGTFSGTVIDTGFTIVDATDVTKQLKFDVQGASATTTTIISNPSVNRNLITPDIDGTALVSQTGTEMVFIGGPTGPLHGSNSGIQYSTTFPSRAQIRLNQYGNNTGVPGVSTFKSRATSIGGLAPVVPGDVIFRDTAVGVTGNLSIPLSGLISIVVPPGGVPAGQGWIATDYELQLVPLNGPANGRKQMFRITSEGIFHIRETANSMAGVATTGLGGSVTVLNTQITATSRITLTIQDGGAVPTGFVYVAGRVIGTSFTIQSSSADVGVQVYYQIWEPTTP